MSKRATNVGTNSTSLGIILLARKRCDIRRAIWREAESLLLPRASNKDGRDLTIQEIVRSRGEVVRVTLLLLLATVIASFCGMPEAVRSG